MQQCCYHKEIKFSFINGYFQTLAETLFVSSQADVFDDRTALHIVSAQFVRLRMSIPQSVVAMAGHTPANVNFRELLVPKKRT